MTPGDSLRELGHKISARFYKPDLQATRIILGALKAHYLNVGDRPWLFVVAPPGSGKTTTQILAASGLSEVIQLGDVTENTFLSGMHGAIEPGLLEKVGRTTQTGNTFTTEGNAILLIKDFTTVLSMRREKRGAILGQLREIHDGSFRRSFGTGVTKIWKGQVTVVAAVTPAIDRHYSIFSTLGERFLQVRWHRPGSEAGVWAIRQQGTEEEIQQELREAVIAIFKATPVVQPVLTEEDQVRIASLSEVIAVARTHVFRGQDRNIEYVPEAEANTRISKGIASIAKGIAALNGRTEVAEPDLQDAFRVGFDSLKANRRQLFMAIRQNHDLESLSITRTVLQREREELHALGIICDNDYDLPPRLTDLVQGLLQKAAVDLVAA